MDLLRRCVAEFIGTFALVFVGVTAVSVSPEKGGGLLSIALAFGLVVAVAVSATLHISGGQINPAVSVALLATGKMGPLDAACYILTQLVAAVAAAGVVQLMFGGDVTANATPVPVLPFTAVKAFVMEVILTFILVFVIFGVAVDRRGPNYLAGLLIGLAVTLDILIGGPYTGASMNPARSFGPALVGGVWTAHWVYWIGPLLGGVLAALVYNTLFLGYNRPTAPVVTARPLTPATASRLDGD